MRKTILCLANSFKHGGRCVAGICLEDGAWIRLRGKAPDGALCAGEYGLDDGTEPRLLDVIAVEVHCAIPSNSHPEDWQIAPVRWHRVERPASAAAMQKLTLSTETTIFGDPCDRIAESQLNRRCLESSLMLVGSAGISWWIRGKGDARKYRALFKRNDITYDFAVTDPRWLEHLDLLPIGIYPHADFVTRAQDTWLTISLSEPFHGWHYKLVAGVIVLAG